jgi:hypothetical protein
LFCVGKKLDAYSIMADRGKLEAGITSASQHYEDAAKRLAGVLVRQRADKSLSTT